MNDDIYQKPGGLVISVTDIEAEAYAGVLQQKLYQNEELAINRLQLNALASLPVRNVASDRFYVVLHGGIVVSGDDMKSRDLGEESMIAIPRDIDVGQRIAAGSEGVTLLELQMLKLKKESLLSEQGVWVDQKILLVNKQEINSYEPKQHTNTINHCLFLNEELEVLISCIEEGGGADTHVHPTQNQYTYVRNPEPARLLHYPKGVVHGGLSDAPNRHDLVVIFSPPYYKVV